jgi:predicted alpha/beta superfamily hydrolase
VPVLRLELAIVLMTFLASASCHVGERAQGVPASLESAPAVTIAASELYTIESTNVGDDIRVSVALPSSYDDSDERYPVIYALDANRRAWFGTYADIARVGASVGELPETIVVGIGYDKGWREVLAARTRDFTPTRDVEQEARLRERVGELSEPIVSGGAATFLRFLQEELFPFIEARYRVEPSRRVIFGHSLGGTFALYVLFHEPQTFTDYVIGSPSIWYGNEEALKSEKAYAEAHEDLSARLFLAVGALEEQKDNARSRRAAMVSNLVELSRRLESRGYPGLALERVVFEAETHNGVVPPTFSRGLRFVFREPR